MNNKKGLVVIGCGGRDIKDENLIEEAIIASGFEIAQIVHGGARGADKLFEAWAKKNKIKIQPFPADWDDLTAPDAKIKERKNPWNGEIEQYNANAGFSRNSEMAEYAAKSGCGACIAVIGGAGTEDMIKKAKEKGLQVFVYEPKNNTEYEYKF